MEQLKIGDIRKFENGVVGVVIEVFKDSYHVVNVDGKVWTVSNTVPCVSPRLKPELRELLKGIADSKVEYEKAREAVSEAYLRSSRAHDEYKKLLNRLETFGEEMSLSSFRDLIKDSLGTVVCCKLEDNGYKIAVSFRSSGVITVEIHKDKIIRKYVSPDNTPFVTSDYDGSMLLETYTSSFQNALQEQVSKCLSFYITEPLTPVFHSDFTIGDKNSLIFHHNVACVLMNGKLNPTTARLIASCINVK